MKETNTIKEFEQMRNLSELKALSNFSLKNPLNDKQFKRMIELKKLFLK